MTATAHAAASIASLTAAIAAQVSVPVIASGGAKTFEDFLAVFGEGQADAALAASIFHTAEHSIGALKKYLAGAACLCDAGCGTPMIIPCIDLQDGKAVQLVRGRKLALSVDDVLGLLERFRDYPILHVIDLDAAIGTGSNGRWIKILSSRAKMEDSRGRRNPHAWLVQRKFSPGARRKS